MTLAPEKPATAEDLITVTIDGFEVSVPKGTLVIRAAEQLGIQIPRFCDHPLLEPAGACRQCLVEVPDMGNGRGMPKPAAACTTTVMPGMVIATQLTSKVADKAQQGVMELLLINHPLDCPVCDKGGECPLQNQAMSNGRADSRFVDVKRTFPKPIPVSSQVLLDRERCVLCQRCTRFSDQIAGDPFIDLLERGAQQQVGIKDTPFQSYFSGNTVQICPVGALTAASYRFRARPFDLMSTPSVCEHCASGCAQRTDWRRGQVTRRLAANDPAVNEEWNCDKGRWGFAYPVQPDRILTPLVRNESGELIEASWPEALERAAEGLREAVDNGGVGVLPGGRLTQEDAYAYSKFARVVLGTNDIDFRARPSSVEEEAFLGHTVVGTTPLNDGVTYADIEAAPSVLLVAFEPEEESPIVFLRMRKSTRLGAMEVFSVAAMASRGLVKLDGTLLQTPPGREAATLAQLDGTVQRALEQDGSVILVGERAATSPGALTAVIQLVERTGARLGWVPRRAGERGALEAGALPALLPGGRPVTDDAARAEVERLWAASVPSGTGRSLPKILSAAANGKITALLVGGVDPADLPDGAALAAALDRVGFVVSLEIRHSAFTERADVVLPVAPVTEKSGTFVSWEGRPRYFPQAIEGTGALSDGRVLNALADEMDAPFGLATAARAAAELTELTTGTARVGPPTEPPAAAQQPDVGQAVLATWAELVDAGRMSDGDDNFAHTAKLARAALNPATAAEIGVREGDEVAIEGPAGVLQFPVELGDLPDRVVWVPTNARGYPTRVALGAGAGDVVGISAVSGGAG
jgi:NADH-quinone oxidoreductase subunit G